MACKVKRAKGGAYLALRLFWNGLRSWETTRLEDTPENRRFLEAQATIISREMDNGNFDYLKHFPNGNKAHLFRREPPRPATPESVSSYFDQWILRRKNQVRAQQVKCERSYFNRHVLTAVIDGQRFGEILLSALALHHIQALQDSLKAKRMGDSDQPYKGASINKYVGALQAMLKDARRTGAMAVNLFDRDLFSKVPESDSESDIDPYLPEERERILKGFLDHRRHYHAFVFHQFWTGCRPSEACALRSGDVDLTYGWERIEKSRVAGAENGTKTGPSNRQVRLHENLVDVLTDHVRFVLDPDTHLFMGPKRTPIAEDNFYKREWLPMLRKLRIRPRPFYNTRHSYASFMLSIGASMAFISAQTGDREQTLKKHYAKYLEAIDPQRKWIESSIRQSAKSARKRAKSQSDQVGSLPAKMKKPSRYRRLRDGAGEEGRTPDLMLGKHTL